jgi:hypothetical protein
MSSEKQRRQHLFLAENVALLSQIHKAPAAPDENPRPQDEDPTRILSLEREVNLTRSLAFICGISNNPNRVVATCVEEVANKNSIRVLVAVNRVGPEFGKEFLARIKEGLEAIFGHLSRVKKGTSHKCTLELSAAYTRDRGGCSSRRRGFACSCGYV